MSTEPFDPAPPQHGPRANPMVDRQRRKEELRTWAFLTFVMALVEEGYPILLFAPRGPAQAGLLELAGAMRERGARVLLAAPAGTPEAKLVLAESALPELDPVCAIQSFYPMVEALARARGNDPDRPPHLQKVTKTR